MTKNIQWSPPLSNLNVDYLTKLQGTQWKIKQCTVIPAGHYIIIHSPP